MAKKKVVNSAPAEAEAKPNEKKLSLISAAAAILAESEEPLNCKRIIELAIEKGLWAASGGKTPELTLYSAIAREIKEKGNVSRFKRSSLRGHYEGVHKTK